MPKAKIVKPKKRCCKDKPRCKKCPVVCKRLMTEGYAEKLDDGRFMLDAGLRKKTLKAARAR